MNLRTEVADLYKIVSGGQTGADRGAFDAAADLGLPFGGWAPRRFRAEDGRIPEVYARHMHESPSDDYRVRTRRNVRDSHGTLIVSIAERLSGGSALTAREARGQRRPCHHLFIDPLGDPDRAGRAGDGQPDASREVREAAVLDWLRSTQILVLCVAGPRESKEPGIQRAARAALAKIFQRWIER